MVYPTGGVFQCMRAVQSRTLVGNAPWNRNGGDKYDASQSLSWSVR